jgi:hypothetical protein
LLLRPTLAEHQTAVFDFPVAHRVRLRTTNFGLARRTNETNKAYLNLNP